ncbi:unnamed protein product [Miscanthus lutarioriparius]|uniref:Uncharacterized protein n=1 Tax=Miscanthus lutarioriparius TaxID=422564 RepID=A0A811PSQ8_9POAL|nr:unnamed protein product [Miscanthus lutarioriparius]
MAGRRLDRKTQGRPVEPKGRQRAAEDLAARGAPGALPPMAKLAHSLDGCGRGHVGTIAPLAVGFLLGAKVLAGAPFDGAEMNPARVFGLALVGCLGFGSIIGSGVFVLTSKEPVFRGPGGTAFEGLANSVFKGNTLLWSHQCTALFLPAPLSSLLLCALVLCSLPRSMTSYRVVARMRHHCKALMPTSRMAPLPTARAALLLRPPCACPDPARVCRSISLRRAPVVEKVAAPTLSLRLHACTQTATGALHLLGRH